MLWIKWVGTKFKSALFLVSDDLLDLIKLYIGRTAARYFHCIATATTYFSQHNVKCPLVMLHASASMMFSGSFSWSNVFWPLIGQGDSCQLESVAIKYHLIHILSGTNINYNSLARFNDLRESLKFM